MGRTLVLGGARSGKSSYAQGEAEKRALDTGRMPVMIVTAQPFDDEMRDRIARHRNDRADRWITLEAPYDLANSIARQNKGDVVVVDCLTLWLSNLMLAEADLESEIQRLVHAVEQCPANLWLVSNEVGLSLVPDNALGRRFRDQAGWLNQKIAAASDQAIMIIAGMKLPLVPL